MTSPPTPRPVTLYAGPPVGPGVEFSARLLDVDEVTEHPLTPAPSSWTITHGLGTPAAGTYTEVRFDPGAVDPLSTRADGAAIERILDDVTRTVARALYGTAWAFHYRPEQYADAVARYGMRRREVVLVDSIEVHA